MPVRFFFLSGGLSENTGRKIERISCLEQKQMMIRKGRLMENLLSFVNGGAAPTPPHFGKLMT